MATPFVRAAVSVDPVASASTKSPTLPVTLADGDLVLLFCCVQVGWPTVGAGWELVHAFGNGSGLTGRVWRWSARSSYAGHTVPIQVSRAQGFAAGLLVIGDPGMAIIRQSQTMGAPIGEIRCVQGLTIGMAFMSTAYGRKLVVESSLTKILTEGDNGVGMYQSVRYGPAAIGSIVRHGIALPGEYTTAGGVLLDLVANPETESFALVKGRRTRSMDQELIG